MEEENNGFKSVSVSSRNRNRGGFSRSVAVPFLSGLVGASLVIGTCFGVPSIKEKLLDEKATTEEIKQTSSTLNTQAISLSDYSDTAIGVAEKVLPSIVGIEIEYEVNSFFGKSTATASGSGIIISENGNILTNNHVVDSSSSSASSYYQVSEAKSIKVSLYNDETQYEAKIVGMDSQTDLAVIKIDKTGLTPAEIGNSDTVKIGEFAMAVGNPQGLATSVTCGIISAVNREVTADGRKYTAIQTDAAINSGNSGGALVNSKGQVIGVNTLKLSGTGIEGIGFAIPINSTTDIAKQLIEQGKVKRPYIGIEGTEVNEVTAQKYNLVEGVYVRSTEDFSAAQKSGIKAGDVIVEVEGKKVTNVEEINEIKNTHNIGDTIRVKIYRNGEYKEIEVTLEEQP